MKFQFYGIFWKKKFNQNFTVSRLNSSSGTDASFRISLKSARGTDIDNRNKMPLLFRCSSPSIRIGVNINLIFGIKKIIHLLLKTKCVSEYPKYQIAT